MEQPQNLIYRFDEEEDENDMRKPESLEDEKAGSEILKN